MAANLDALKKLYANIGGEADVSDVTRISVMIDKIADIAPDAILPEVGTDGQVMKVVSGKWAAANA